MMKIFLTLLIILYSPLVIANDSIKVNSDTSVIELKLNKMDLYKIESLIKEENRTWIDKYGSILVALVALLGVLGASLVTSYYNRLNIDKQIASNLELELERKNIERKYELENELKLNIAKFIRVAIRLNEDIDEILKLDEEEIELEYDSWEKYYETKTEPVIKEISDIYYSIKVALDNSKKHKKLEGTLDLYVSVTCTSPKIEELKGLVHSSLIAMLFSDIRAIIHDTNVDTTK